MRFAPLLCSLLLLFPLQGGESPVRFRQWIAGQESGWAEQRVERKGNTTLLSVREWQRVERLGMAVEQTVEHRYERGSEGTLTIQWTLKLAQEPLRGTASWNPLSPEKLELRPERGEARTVTLVPGTVLWPLDQEARLKEAARTRQPVSIPGYSLPTQQASELHLNPIGPDPLPGFPDAVRFQGDGKADGMPFKVTAWLSPTLGELKMDTEVAGLSLLLQRAELPPPNAKPGQGFFEQTLKALPPHPLLSWMPTAHLRWTGTKPLDLPTTPQQRFLPDRSLELTRATDPTALEAKEAPVKGKPTQADAPFLAATPLVDFKDPVFEGLLARLNPPEGASRWELARRVTHFVFEWIEVKDLSVGFASAQEVARSARGDCTEHGVLAVALLRRLGVPARGVTGWVVLGDTLGLHFWVEIKLGQRWIPVDPTFDEVPASALHIQLGSSDLRDLGSLGWEQAALDLTQGGWIPVGPWPSGLQVLGEALAFPGGQLRAAGGRWSLTETRLSLRLPGSDSAVHVEACPRPPIAHLAQAQLLQDAQTGLRGWRKGRELWIAFPDSRWLKVDGASEAAAFRLLAALSLVPTPQ